MAWDPPLPVCTSCAAASRACDAKRAPPSKDGWGGKDVKVASVPASVTDNVIYEIGATASVSKGEEEADEGHVSPV